MTTGDADLRSIEVALNGLLRRMQEAKLQQMRFVSDASHELRTPIAVIQGYVNMLDRWGKTDESVLDESIEALKSESAHMKELVEQLLFLARGDSGRTTLHRTTFNLAAMVGDVWEESAMIDPGHSYRLLAPEDAGEDPSFAMVGDVALVKQSMRVIVQNAAKYSPAGSTIALGVERDAASNAVAYTVKDEGVGMSREDSAHAFERFWRLRPGPQRRHRRHGPGPLHRQVDRGRPRGAHRGALGRRRGHAVLRVVRAGSVATGHVKRPSHREAMSATGVKAAALNLPVHIPVTTCYTTPSACRTERRPFCRPHAIGCSTYRASQCLAGRCGAHESTGVIPRIGHA